jgi:hypothetical protein
MNAFPNPSAGIIHITLNEKFNSGYEVAVYNSNGAAVQKLMKMADDRDFDINMTGYAPGIYVIRAHNNTKSLQARVIKK